MFVLIKVPYDFDVDSIEVVKTNKEKLPLECYIKNQQHILSKYDREVDKYVEDYKEKLMKEWMSIKDSSTGEWVKFIDKHCPFNVKYLFYTTPDKFFKEIDEYIYLVDEFNEGYPEAPNDFGDFAYTILEVEDINDN